MWIFVCICIIKGNNNNQTDEEGEEANAGAAEIDEQVEGDAGAAATNEQVEEAAAAAAAATPAAATHAPATDVSAPLPANCPVSPALSSPPRTWAPDNVMEALLYAGRGFEPRPSTPVQRAAPIINTLPDNSGALRAFTPVTPPKGPPPIPPKIYVTMMKAAMNRPLGLVPQPSAKPGTSTLAASSSHTPMSPLPQPADASLGEAALDEVGGRGNATGMLPGRWPSERGWGVGSGVMGGQHGQ